MEEHSFEESFKRLEEILDTMNEGKASLDESIKLYTEADALITNCNQKLGDAEKKIEMLIKNREGEINVLENQEVEKAPFSAQQDSPSS